MARFSEKYEVSRIPGEHECQDCESVERLFKLWIGSYCECLCLHCLTEAIKFDVDQLEEDHGEVAK